MKTNRTGRCRTSLSGDPVSDPEELVISREEFNDIELKMNEILSDLNGRS